MKIIQMMHTIVTKTDCFGNDSFYVMCYALRIMHYEFIQTRTSYETHDRASLREGVLSDAWISLQLCIMNYAL